MNTIPEYDVIIIGAGVSGTALLYTLGNFSTIKRILLIEKHTDVAQVSSHFTQNSQTLHYGDIESNYSLEKATAVKAKAELVEFYVNSVGKNDGAAVKKNKMLLAVGAEEVKTLEERFNAFKNLFPRNTFLTREEIAKREPKLVEGRDPKVPLAAILSPDGYIMDYYALAKSFVKQTQGKTTEVMLGTEVLSLHAETSGYTVHTNQGSMRCKVLVSDAGAMSIRFAKSLGFGTHLAVMSLGGNFYRGPEVLQSKVYTMQHPARPNAAVHGDPDVRGTGYTRFGPTANILLQLERRNAKTILPYFKTINWTPRGLWYVIKTGLDPVYGLYVIKNMFYDVPWFGKRLLIKEIQKIVPTIKPAQIKKEKGYGAARPQIIDTRTGKVNLGEARVEGPNAIFNVTPSPGASTCLANAMKDAKQISTWLNETFDEEKMRKTLTAK